MVLRIIAFVIVICFNLGTFSLANQKSNLSDLKWKRSIKTRMFLGLAVGLAGGVVAATNKDKNIKGDNAALGAALLGFGYAFWNWMKLHPPSNTGFTYIQPRKGHYERRIVGYELQRNFIYDQLQNNWGWSDYEMQQRGFNEYDVVPQYDWVWVPDDNE